MEDAESLADQDRAYHSAGGLVVPIPSVLKLHEWAKIPMRSKVAISRRNLLARDLHTCAYCGGPAPYAGSQDRRGTIDHVYPRALGGRHVWENIVAACGPCNFRKGSKTLAQLGWKPLDFKPAKPLGHLFLVPGLLSDEPMWEPYVRHLTATG
jgi:5-methylcytosine-specific restriction endonuclease McrA